MKTFLRKVVKGFFIGLCLIEIMKSNQRSAQIARMAKEA